MNGSTREKEKELHFTSGEKGGEEGKRFIGLISDKWTSAKWARTNGVSWGRD